MIKKRTIKANACMPQEMYDYLIKYLFEYENKHNGEKPPMHEYAMEVKKAKKKFGLERKTYERKRSNTYD